MKKILFILTSVVVFEISASAQIGISSGTTTYSYDQNFNGLPSTGTVTWVNNSTIEGWSLFKTTSSTPVTSFDTGTGSGTTGNFVSFGSTGSSDRALGGLGSNNFNGSTTASGTVSGYIALSFLNNSGGATSSFTLNYDGEQWRNAGVTSTHTTLFQYGFGSSFTGVTSWTAAGSGFNFTSPIATTTGTGALDGNATANRSAARGGTVSGLNWANGSTLWLRWLETNESGNDHGLAIDNVSFSTTFAAAAASYGWSGGNGTWQNGQSGNFGATYNNATDSAVTFSGTSGDVTVSGAVEAGSLAFTSGGYALNSGSLTVGQGSITTDTGTTTINSVLEGTAGLIKSGTGALVLTGANTVAGAVSITGGTLQIGSDGALGNAANDIANNGTLKTTSNIALGAGRDITGSGTLDIADGTTLTVNGVTSTSGLTLANTGTLAFNNAASNPGNLTTTYTSGTARVTGNLNLGATDKIVNVAGGGALEVAGTVSLTSGTGTELTKEGAGTLILSGSGSSISRVQIGRTGATPTAGGTLRVADSASLGAQEMYFNYGTLEAANNLSTSVGVSLGGRNGAETVIGGSGGSADVTFNGAARFYGATGTSGEFALKVNNNTTLAGGISASTGSRTGLTLGGTGTLKITGNSSTFTDTITTADTVKLVVNNTLGAGVNVGSGSLLGGSGVIGALTVSTGGTLTPGNSPGLLTATSATFQSGSNLNWEIFNAVGTAGVDWDLLSVTGNLNVAALSSGSMNLVLKSLSALPDTVGALAGFNSNDTFYSWTFARAATITGSTGALTSGQDVTSLFSVNDTYFNLGTAPTSGWKVMTGTETVSGTTYQTLNLLAVPEPSAQSLFAFGMVALVAVRSLRRKQS